MKKILSLLLAALTAISIVLTAGAAFDKDGNWVPVNDKWDAISREGVVARLAIGGDIHFPDCNSLGKMPAVYRALEQIGGVDAMLIAGDLTHTGGEHDYESLMECVNKYTSKNTINPDATGSSVGATILSMGNHEFWNDVAPIAEERFTEYTGMEPDKLYWLNGIPIIALSPDNHKPDRAKDIVSGNNYDLSYDFLKAAYDDIDAKGYDGAIIVIAHHRPDNEGDQNKYFSNDIMKLMKDHPNTMIFTGHSHTWIQTNIGFIFQDAGFTHVRAGSLANDYGGLGSADINPSTGKPLNPLETEYDTNCSLVLVDILEDGKVKLRRLDVAKGEYYFENEDIIVDPKNIGYYTRNDNEGTYGHGTQAPTFASNAKVTVEDQGNNSSVIVKFPEATAASELARDFISEYRIRFADTNGNYFKYEDKDYIRVANYRAKADEDKDWSVIIHGLAWDTDYTVQVQARTPYGAASEWITCENTVNVGHGTPTYPAVPVIDFDYSYGSAKDGAGHALVTTPLIVNDVDINGQKAANILGLGDTPYSYEFTEEDFLSVKNYFTAECYFSATDIKAEQCLMGGMFSCNFALKIMEGQLHVWASIVSMNNANAENKLILSTDIEANEWYHAMVVYDCQTLKLYLNGELVDKEDYAPAGLDPVSYEPEDEDVTDTDEQQKVTKTFCVGGGNYDADGTVQIMGNCNINKATLYSGIMTDEDVKNAYKVATTAMPFTDVKDEWYIDSVEYAYVTGLMSGTNTAQTTFEPSTKTTRAMIVQMLYNMEGKPAVEYKNVFADVKEKDWYAPAIIWAYENGVTTGTSDTTFSPNTLVSREQVAVFLYRYMRDYKKADVGEGADLSSYPDADSISSYKDFAEAVAWANANGIIGGKSNGGVITLSPHDKAMRSEVAKMFVSFAKKF